MVACAEAGAMILPAMPAFYQQPKTIDDLADVHRRQDPERARLRAAAVPALERRVSVSTSKEPARIAGMFDAIARRYDPLNHLLSAGLDKRWRRRAVRELRLTASPSACSTSAPAPPIWRSKPPAARAAPAPWSGVDFSARCCRSASTRFAARGSRRASPWREAMRCACRSPMPRSTRRRSRSGSATSPTRWPDAGSCTACLRPGGRLAILEFGMPEMPVLAAPLWLVLPPRPAARRAFDLTAFRRVPVPTGLGGRVSFRRGVCDDSAAGRLFGTSAASDWQWARCICTSRCAAHRTNSGAGAAVTSRYTD